MSPYRNAALWVGSIALLAALDASASSGGIVGRTNLGNGLGCQACHNQAENASMSVGISGPATLNPGQTGTYTLTATLSGTSGQNIGLNVAVSRGSLGTNGAANLKILSSELTHQGTLQTANASGSGSYTFQYTNPSDATDGSVTTMAGVARIGFSGGWHHAANKTITTVVPTFALTVNKAGSGTGTVTSNPAGIDCGADCTQNYFQGTVVALSVTPVAPTVFTGWSGNCSGTGACSVTMSGARSVTANLWRPPVITSSLTASGTFGSPFSYTIAADHTPQSFNATGLPAFLTRSNATVSGTPTSVGTFNVTISATNPGGTDTETLQITIGKASQAITFNPQLPAARPFVLNSTFGLNPVATASSGLAPTYSSLTGGICSISGETVTMLAVGNCIIAANQAGDANYNPALQATQTILFTLGGGTGPSAIAVNPITNTIYVVNTTSNNVTVIDGSTNSAVTIPVGTSPVAIAVNTATNKIYVANRGSTASSANGTVTVIDGATLGTTPVTVGAVPSAIAVNPATNKIYVANRATAGGTSGVTVIDGATLGTLNVPAGSRPQAIAVNAITNRIYVANNSDQTVTVINGADNSTASVPIIDTGVNGVAVNPVTNRIYVTASGGTRIAVIDGATNVASIINANSGSGPRAIAVNPVTNRIYVANEASTNVTVVNGADNSVSYVAATGTTPSAVAINPATNRIYVPNFNGDNVTVIDGATNTGSSILVGNGPIAAAVNPVTNRIYVAENLENNVRVILGDVNTPVTVPAGLGTKNVAIHPNSDFVYVTNYDAGTVTRIDSANATTTIPVSLQPLAIAIDPFSKDRAYVANQGSDSVSVIEDGAVRINLSVGSMPYAIAINPATRRVYVANRLSGTMSVIDDLSVLTTFSVGSQPHALGVNPVTNRIYVANYNGSSVTVVEGTTHAKKTLPTGPNPYAIAVNRDTNKTYVSHATGSNISVIDATDTVQTISVAPDLGAIAVNPVTNRIFVAAFTPPALYVIDGNTNTVLGSVPVGGLPTDVKVDIAANKVYVSSLLGERFFVVDPATLTGKVAQVGQNPRSIAVHPSNGRVYVGNEASNDVTVLTPVAASLPQIPLTTSVSGIPGARTSRSSILVTFTAQTTFGPAVPPIRAVYYRIDGGQGGPSGFTAASGAAPSFTADLGTLPRGHHVLHAFAMDDLQATSFSTSNDGAGGTGAMTGRLVSFPFVVTEPPSITTAVSVLPAGLLDTSYSFTFTATQGSGGVVFAAEDPSDLPGGLTINPQGQLQGTPTHRGSFNFRITATDSSGTVVGKDFTLTILGAPTDFNADNRSDLVFAHTDGRIALWLMNGGTVTSNPVILGAGTGFAVKHIDDLDNNRRNDLVFHNPDGRVVVWTMNGTTVAGSATLLGVGNAFVPTHTGDFNGDGKADILFTHPDGRVVIYLMDGTVPAGGGTILGPGTGWAVTRIADFNGDGLDDILWTHTDGRVSVWFMNGASVVGGGGILGAGTGWHVLHTPDLNGDGKADVVWQHNDGRVAIWTMDGVTITGGGTVFGGGTAWTVARIGDFNGDGKHDLLWQHPDGRAVIWLMNGAIATSQVQILNAGGGWSAARTGDLNGDGKSDIVWQNVDGRVVVWLMNGTTNIGGGTIQGPATGWSVSTVSQ